MTRHLLGSYSRSLRPILPAVILMFGLALAHPDAAQGAILFVATTGNNAGNCPANSPCKTITYALGVANAGDTISVAAGTYNHSAEILPLIINKNLTISGAGAASTIIDATGANQRVITINSGTVTITGVTIMGGNTSDVNGGAGIFNAGTLTLNNSIVSGNLAQFGGGGIHNTGTSTLNNSTVSGNVGNPPGGGIYNDFGTLTLNNSTVSNNKSNSGGGIFNRDTTTTLNNSTVSNNSTNGYGGGIVNECNGNGAATDHFVATLILNNSTVSGNSAALYGGGILNESDKLSGCAGAVITLNNSTVSGNTTTTYGGGIAEFSGNTPAYPATITLKNSIVAGNTGNPGANCSGTMTSLGHNIADDASCGLTGIGDMNNTNPVLGPLANNGGPTLTLTPQLGSAAIDGVPLANCTDANNAPIATDQRGIVRPQGAACDVGSVEFQTQTFEYAVKFVCGRAASTTTSPTPVATGFYFTAINVHNPNSGPISFTKKFAVALPSQKAGIVSQPFPAALKSDEAFEVECGEITSDLKMAPLSFVTGFAVFRSVQEIDIVAVYTTAANQTGSVVTMQTERVPKRP
jgi:hypothetical protein